MPCFCVTALGVDVAPIACTMINSVIGVKFTTADVVPALESRSHAFFLMVMFFYVGADELQATNQS